MVCTHRGSDAQHGRHVHLAMTMYEACETCYCSTAALHVPAWVYKRKRIAALLSHVDSAKEVSAIKHPHSPLNACQSLNVWKAQEACLVDSPMCPPLEKNGTTRQVKAYAVSSRKLLYDNVSTLHSTHQGLPECHGLIQQRNHKGLISL